MHFPDSQLFFLTLLCNLIVCFDKLPKIKCLFFLKIRVIQEFFTANSRKVDVFSITIPRFRFTLNMNPLQIAPAAPYF